MLLEFAWRWHPVLVCLICWQGWKACGFHENLRLPDHNEFIPVNFDLAPREAEVGVEYILEVKTFFF